MVFGLLLIDVRVVVLFVVLVVVLVVVLAVVLVVVLVVVLAVVRIAVVELGLIESLFKLLRNGWSGCWSKPNVSDRPANPCDPLKDVIFKRRSKESLLTRLVMFGSSNF